VLTLCEYECVFVHVCHPHECVFLIDRLALFYTNFAEGVIRAKVRKGSFLDANRVLTMKEDGQNSFGVNRMSGWPVLGNNLGFGIDQPILRSPRPHLGSEVN